MCIRDRAEALRKRLEPRWRYEVPDGLDLDAIPEEVLDVYELAIAPVEFAAPAGAASRRAAVPLPRRHQPRVRRLRR